MEINLLLTTTLDPGTITELTSYTNPNMAYANLHEKLIRSAFLQGSLHLLVKKQYKKVNGPWYHRMQTLQRHSLPLRSGHFFMMGLHTPCFGPCI